MSEKSVKPERSARVAFNAIEHLLLTCLCSVGTILLREFSKNAFGFLDLSGFLKPRAFVDDVHLMQ